MKFNEKVDPHPTNNKTELKRYPHYNSRGQKMKNTKTRKKALKILFFAAILLTATNAAILIQSHDQNTYPPINLYLQGFSQNYPTVIREKIDISETTTLNGGFYYETINVTADNIVINGNGSTVQGTGTGYGFKLTGRSNVTIFNVTVNGWGFAFLLFRSSNNNLTGNIVTENSYGFYLVNGSNNNTFSGNTVNNNAYGFFSMQSATDPLLYSSNNNTFSGNTATNNGEYGFWLWDSSYNNFSNNTANNNNYGFNLYDSSYNILSGNTATNNDESGFYLSGSYNNFTGNIAANNGRGGFWLQGSSYNNFTGNTANNNGNYGFHLYESSYNTITGNTIVTFLGFGFYLNPGSHDNIIENNTVTITGFPLLYFLFYSVQQQIVQPNFTFWITTLVAGGTAVLIGLAYAYYRSRKNSAATPGKPEPERI